MNGLLTIQDYSKANKGYFRANCFCQVFPVVS